MVQQVFDVSFDYLEDGSISFHDVTYLDKLLFLETLIDSP